MTNGAIIAFGHLQTLLYHLRTNKLLTLILVLFIEAFLANIILYLRWITHDIRINFPHIVHFNRFWGAFSIGSRHQADI